MNDCQCNIVEGGYCERHGVDKSAHWVDLCRTDERYWQAWEAHRGPGQMSPGGKRQRPQGWGDKVETWLKTLGVTPEKYMAIKAQFGLPPTCGCAKRREWLNKVGRWLTGEPVTQEGNHGNTH